ncbi:DUF1793-domain-containing protein [Hysterangium stoloniferum]|nr:DUF1793-domain-containing protein [Hysterangium stoloniferum]
MRVSISAPLLVGFLVARAVANVTWTATPLNPPAVPLAVRSPYLSAWLKQGSGQALNDDWPTFWTGMIVGWAGFVRVDGVPYSFLGNPTLDNGVLKAVQKNFTYTSTQSTFVLSAGPIDVTANFLSPVEPTDLVKLSLPFSYLAVSAASTDGNMHSVQIYTDISAEWVSGDLSLTAEWSTTTLNGIITHQVQLANQTLFGEVADHTQYGSTYYSVQNPPNTVTTFQSGPDIFVRSQFTSHGRLTNGQDPNFRAINNDWPVFGFARDLGKVGPFTTENIKNSARARKHTPSTVVFSIGHVRDPLVQYITASGLQNRTGYWRTRYKSVDAAIEGFLPAYSTALSSAVATDAKISKDSLKISADYEAIVTLSVRQAMGSWELTVGPDLEIRDGNVMAFMKEISSDGNMNTVDVIFPAWPIFLYLNPALGKYLLEPLFQYQASGLYPNPWSVHDMGSNYPKALGHNDGRDEAMPVEESGNMLIMTLSYTQQSNDKTLITKYAKLLNQWTQFLISDSLIPANQLSTDDFAGTLSNQTNLAIKGTIGIKAMSIIEGLLGNTATAANYSSIAMSYAPQIVDFATGTGANGLKHFELSYGNPDSWGLTYNLMADKLLGTEVFAESLFKQQSAWYPTVAQEFGIPLDTRHTYTKSDWQIWTAATATDITTRDLFVSSVRKYIASGVNSAPFSDWYETTNAKTQGFRARPVAGGHLALLVV